MKRIIWLTVLLGVLSGQVFAEKRYVTDRILLGIHEEADETSTLVKSVPSGTELEVLETDEGFVKVRLNDGTEGWASSGFIMKNAPETRKYDILANQYEKTTQELDEIKKDMVKKDRELQIRRDQVSNAKTTIRELKKRSGNDGKDEKGGNEVVVDPEIENKLSVSLEEIAKLKLQITELEKKAIPKVDVDKKQIIDELKQVKEQNKTMQTRVEVALAHLNGERMPTPEELASIRPQFPAWYWGLLAVMLLVGIIAGLFVMDHRFRQRHGGFRI